MAAMHSNMLLTRWSGICSAIVVSLLVGSFAAVHADEAVVNPPVTPVAKQPLQGAAILDDALPGLPDQFHVGSQFDQSALQGLTPDNVWFPIPNWFAGKWHGESRTVDFIEDCQSGVHESPHAVMKEVQDTTMGYQRDKTGQIWHFVEIPRWRKVEDQKGFAYLHALREDVLDNDASHVVLKILNNQMLVDGGKQTILSSHQVQQIGTYIPVEDGLVRLDASLKTFDADGSPKIHEECSALMKRTAPYEDLNTLNGLDLKQLFIEYLKKTGRQDLLPG
jgi:hypothetical protein